VKTAGLKSTDIASALLAQKAMATLGVDAKALSQIFNIEKLIADNGVPAVEIARVLADGGMPKELADELTAQVLLASTSFGRKPFDRQTFGRQTLGHNFYHIDIIIIYIIIVIFYNFIKSRANVIKLFTSVIYDCS
jgi:hypothetical protein